MNLRAGRRSPPAAPRPTDVAGFFSATEALDPVDSAYGAASTIPLEVAIEHDGRQHARDLLLGHRSATAA